MRRLLTAPGGQSRAITFSATWPLTTNLAPSRSPTENEKSSKTLGSSSRFR